MPEDLGDRRSPEGAWGQRGLEATGLRKRAFEHAAVAEAVAVALADDARLHERAVARHSDRVRVVVAQVEVACRQGLI